MKILVMSDNHGRYELVQTIIQNLKDQVDIIVHCGDSEFSSDDPIWSNFDGVVRGNMDFDGDYPNEQVVSTPKGTIYLTHGHLLAVNATNAGVLEQAKQTGSQFAFHGHTHRLYAEVKDGVLLANPGSLNHSRGEYPGTSYMIADIEGEKITVQYFDEHQKVIPSLTQIFN